MKVQGKMTELNTSSYCHGSKFTLGRTPDEYFGIQETTFTCSPQSASVTPQTDIPLKVGLSRPFSDLSHQELSRLSTNINLALFPLASSSLKQAAFTPECLPQSGSIDLCTTLCNNLIDIRQALITKCEAVSMNSSHKLLEVSQNLSAKCVDIINYENIYVSSLVLIAFTVVFLKLLKSVITVPALLGAVTGYHMAIRHGTIPPPSEFFSDWGPMKPQSGFLLDSDDGEAFKGTKPKKVAPKTGKQTVRSASTEKQSQVSPKTDNSTTMGGISPPRSGYAYTTQYATQCLPSKSDQRPFFGFGI